MTELYKLLSNREISILIWSFVIFTILIISAKGGFGQLMNIVKALFSKKFLPFYASFIAYFALIIYFLNSIEIWEFTLYKDFTYWFLTTALVLFFNSNDLKTSKDFTKIALTAISLTIILEFIIGYFNFSLVAELILVPIVTFISILSIVAQTKKSDRNTATVVNFLQAILSIVGFGVLIYCLYQLIKDYSNFFTFSNLKSFLLPPIFTFLFLPFIYFTVLYIKYEIVFGNLRRYKFLTETKKKKIRHLILRYANVQFKNIDKANQIIVFNKKELKEEKNIKSYLRKAIKQNS